MESRAHAVLDPAWKAGVRYFDAARSYGRAEALLASWHETRQVRPGTVAVGSKWGYTYAADWKVARFAVQSEDKHSIRAGLFLFELTSSTNRIQVRYDGDRKDVTMISNFKLSQAERAIYRRYAALALPRHTSYPIAPAWRDDYRTEEFRKDLRLIEGPLSLYVHLPFCERLCFYCACTKEIIPAVKRREHDPAEGVLAGLADEVSHFADALADHEVHQVHLGGGSPTFFSSDQLTRLWHLLQSRFTIAPDAEIAVEIDPRITTHDQLHVLRQLGFNRVSIGVQDFAPHVQQAINRLQPYETVAQVVTSCRELGFGSINFDLIYGLPFQTMDSMADTLEKTLVLAPDRIAFYRLAVIPDIFRWQKVFKPNDLPAGDLPLELNLLAINRFLQAGYEFLGLDHFAKPSEPLAQAYKSRTLQRNFQGMTTGKPCELIGLGPSAISQLEHAFAQNWKTTAEWHQAVGSGFAVERGLRLSQDDRVRRELMQQLYGYGLIDAGTLAAKFGISFAVYFAEELQRVRVLAEEGLLVVEEETIRLTAPLGRLLVRVVAAVFDRYLPADAFQKGLPANQSSKVG
jgi:oxygen-independent coproporphyrinogen III oxidase